MFDLREYTYDEEAARRLAGVSIKACDEAAINETNASFRHAGYEDEARKRLREGHTMVGAFWRGQLVACVWLSFQPPQWYFYPPMEIEKYLGEKSAFLEFEGGYLWDAYTSPDFRRKGILRQVSLYALGIAKNRTTRAYAVAETDNYPSCRSLDAMGGSRIKITSYLRLFKWKRYTEHDISPRSSNAPQGFDR